MLNLPDPSLDSKTAINVDREMVATPVMPSLAMIPAPNIVKGVGQVSPPSEEKRWMVSWSLPASSQV